MIEVRSDLIKEFKHWVFPGGEVGVKFVLKDDLTYDEYNTEEGMELDQLKPVLYNQQVRQESFQDIRIRVNEAVEKKVRKVLDKS